MKNPILVVTLVLLLCFTLACQNKAEKAELEKYRAQAKVEEQNKDSFRYWLEETDKGNYAAWDKVCSADYVSHWGEISFNLEEHKQANRPLKVAFPNLKHEINNMIAKADRVVVRVTLTGTHEGEYMGIPPTGNKIKYTAMLEGRFSEGKVDEIWGNGDMLTLMQQLGMELKPKEVNDPAASRGASRAQLQSQLRRPVLQIPVTNDILSYHLTRHPVPDRPSKIAILP